MKVSKIYYKFFKEKGYKEVFGLPGSYIMPLWQEFGDEIKIILSRHENGAVFMADGWARNNNLPGIVLTTIGPGLTNAITGIACAYEDSIPLIIISGYVSTNLNNKGAFQNSSKLDRGFEPKNLLKSITKKTYLPQTADEAIRALENAFVESMSGRKGPVHISLPFDVANMESKLSVNPKIEEKKFSFGWEKQFTELYNESKRPIFFCGNGCFLSNGTEIMNKVSKKLNIPILSSIKGASACSIDNKNYLGLTGNILKPSIKNFLVEYKPDLVISLGSSLSMNSFNEFDLYFKNSKIIRIDIDKKQFANYKNADLNILCDVKVFLEKINLISLIPKKNDFNYVIDEEIPKEDDNLFSKISDYMYRNTDKNTLFIPDAGNHWLDILYWCYPKDRLGIFTNAGLASMGHAIGASIGFKIANPNKNVICISGDGSIMMSGFEIAEAIEENINIMFIILNNSSLGRARVYQEMTDGNIVSTCYSETMFYKIFDTLGANSTSVKTFEEFKNAFSILKKKDGVKVIEVIVDNKDCPKILGGK